MKTLIVEDSPVNKEFLAAIVSPHGDCVAVESGEEAIEEFDKALSSGEKFDLIFMDIILPGIDGLQALEKIRAREDQAGIPEDSVAKVVVTTALDDDQKASRAFFQGRAVSYLTKPFTVSKISGELKKMGFI